MTWKYQRDYLRAHPGPTWTCYFCDLLIDHRGVDSRALSVHHIDHDHGNNTVENLIAAHKDCHNSYHSRGRKHSEDAKAKIGATHSGKVVSVDTRARLRAALIGTHPSEETRAKRRNYPVVPCDICGVHRTIGSPMANHMKVHA